MHFSRKISVLMIGLFFASVWGCGAKKPAERTLLPGNDVGCYDKLGDRVSRFFDGAIDNVEWQDTFVCVNQQITFFRKYVRGNEPDGYNQSDIAYLVRRFLIIDHPVSDRFIASVFDIKASIFGGSPNVISPTEIDEFLKMSEVVRAETTAMLPYLQAKRRAPNAKNLLILADGIETFGNHLANYLRTLKGTMDVRKASFLPFIRELIAIHGGDPTLVDRYGDFVRNLKVVIAIGTPEVIEAPTWATLVQEGAAFGGLLLAYHNMENGFFNQPGEKDQFQIDLAHRAQVAINRVIRRHGVGIPLEVFNPVIDTLPLENLTPEKRVAIKHDLPLIISRAFRGGAPGWLTPAAIGTIADLFETGMRQQFHLKRIYEDLSENPGIVDFESAARKYQDAIIGSREREDVNSLIAIGKNYIGLFANDSSEIKFTSEMHNSRTLNHMIRMSWFDLLIRHALSIYGTGPELNWGAKSARKEDLALLSDDFEQILVNWKLTVPEMSTLELAGKRFLEANVFMPASNGDSYMDQIEGTYYIAFLFSSGAFSGRIFRAVTENSPQWSACPIIGVDHLNQPAVDAKCFREVYFGHPEVFWTNFPGLQVAYAKLSPDEKVNLARSMEAAARFGGYSEKPIGPFDTDAFAGIPHYVEDIMSRFDRNNDQILDKREILDFAFPIFKTTLATAVPGTKSDFILKGILTYIVKYGRAPPGTLSLLAWCARLPVTNVTADRAALYRVVALLSAPLELEKSKTNSSWPLEGTNLFPTATPL